VTLLTLGLAFSSNNLAPGSTSYYALATVTLVVIGAAVLVFAGTLVFEVYCSLQYAAILNTARLVARAMEETALEEALKQSSTKRPKSTPSLRT
jgi:hypothetical protein